MTQLHLLVADGDAAPARAQTVAVSGKTFSEAYGKVLSELAQAAGCCARIHICHPADPASPPATTPSLDGYDGVVLTGSSLHLWKAEPESLRQVDFARAVFAAQTPFFGSCWGLQVAAVAAGGAVRPNPKGREIGFARNITLTNAGRSHPLHNGKPWSFNAPAVHLDEIYALPQDATATAFNSVSQVQAAEIRFGGGVFWGVQYHPEYDLAEIAETLRGYGPRLVQEGFYRDEDAMRAHLTEIETLRLDPSRRDVAWKLGVDQDILDPAIRLAELRNWIAYCARRRRRR